MEIHRTEKAIEILTNTKQELNELFESNPGLTLRLNHVFTSLINNFKHTINQGVINQKPEEMKKKPLKSVFGVKIQDITETQQTVEEKVKQPDRTEVDKLREEINQIIPTLIHRDPDEIIEGISELHLRGVAKTLGLQYDQDVKVNSDFVKLIQENIIRVEEKASQQELNKKESLQSSGDIDMELLYNEYKKLYGRYPNKTWAVETIQRKIDEALSK